MFRNYELYILFTWGTTMVGPTSTHIAIEGDTLKNVKCGKCQKHFYYQAERQGRGASLDFAATQRAENLSANRASEMLDSELEKAIDLVACPHCGWFQSSMIAAKKKKILVSMAKVGALMVLPVLIYSWAKSMSDYDETGFVLYFILTSLVVYGILGVATIVMVNVFNPKQR